MFQGTATGIRETSEGNIAIVAAVQYAVKHECNNAISPQALGAEVTGREGVPDIYGVSR